MDFNSMLPLYRKNLKTPEELKTISHHLQLLVDSDSGFSTLSQPILHQIIQKLEISEFQDAETVFNKGDPSDCLYIILSGALQMYTLTPHGFLSPEKVITKGIIGERGILKNKYRSLTAVAKGHTFLLSLDAKTFKKYLIDQVSAEQAAKRAVVEKYIPCVWLFNETQRVKIAYAIKFEVFVKGMIMLKKNSAAESLKIVLEGECAMIDDTGNKKKTVALLDSGSIIGEDSAFFDRFSLFYVVATSDTVKVASIRISDIRTLFPHSVVLLLREFFTQRNSARSKLALFNNPYLKSFTPRSSGTATLLLSSANKKLGFNKEKQVLMNFSCSSILNKKIL
jgi:CRP-like cAMP-binding protein